MTIPPDMSRAEVIEGSTATRERLLALAHARLAADWCRASSATIESPAQREELADLRRLDVLVAFLDSSGDPILPDLEHLGERLAVGAEANELRFTFDSTQYPWSPDEVSRLTSALAQFYPVAKAVYGPPAFDITVNVVKDPTIGYAGVYNRTLNTITLSNGESLDALCHEMIHAFRDEFLAALSAYEEGMTRAAEIEVYDRLGLDNWLSGHDYTYDRYYDALSTSAIGVRDGIYKETSTTFMLLRYQLAGYAWGKATIENPSFLADFNRQYYGRAADPLVRRDVSALRQIAASVQRTVEGRDFESWYDLQGIFATMPPEGCQLYSRINQYTVDFFCRDSAGTETVQSGALIDWSLYDHHGALMSSGSATTSAYGWIDTGLPPPDYSGRLIVAGAVRGRPEISTSAMRLPLGDGGDYGVFGVVPSALLGTVTVSSLDQSAASSTVQVTDGGFYARDLAGLRGRFRATLQTSDGRRLARRFTKDWGSYFLTMDCGTAPAAGTTAGITSSSSTSIVGHDVTFAATVSVIGHPTVLASGVVGFTADSAAIPGCAGLDLTGSGVATCTTAFLAPGSHSIVASFAPDCGFGASVSVPIAQAVVRGVRRHIRRAAR